ncbi:MAG TPA: non-ribosomal peptide synthetase, partial [Pyrinomonadaceae bacterium]
RRLRALGVGAEALVGVCLERSPGMLAGLLGILKAGGAYLPLDPSYPPERLAFMLSDSGVGVVLTQRRLEGRLRGYEGALLYMDETEGAEEEGTAGTQGAAGVTTAENLAYVIYTSGSTGRPKGVTVEHRNVTNFFAAMDEAVGGEGPGTWLALTSLSFDISVLELLWTLARGFRVVLRREEYKSGPTPAADEPAPDTASGGQSDKTAEAYTIASQIAAHGVTHLQCTPSMARLLAADEDSLRAARSLRTLLLGGEALPAPLAALFLEGSSAQLFNMYGPTETTIWSATHRVESAGGHIPLGRPVANTALYVLDGRGEPAPVGVPGELYIGGEGVTRGYLGRAALTAERFVPDPFGASPGARLYRTGDRVRYLPGGEVEFLGRMDQQVKLRGFRIELGEVEAVIALHPDVREVVVVAHEDSPGDRRLVAYCVANTQPPPSGDHLRSFLRERLPEYMIPAAFVLLEKLPLTPGGKINRQALPSPESSSREPLEHTPPRDETEAVIVRIWEEVLKLAPVSVNDNFFDLGGHSLLAIQVQRKINAALGRSLSVAELFQHPTVSALARHLNRQGDDEPSFQQSYARAELRLARLGNRRASNQTKPSQ